MLRVAVGWLVAVLLPASAYLQSPAVSGRGIVFTNATVIDVKGGQSTPDMTVLVSGNRIAALGKTGEVRPPTDAQAIDASGKYLIPGLWDMHAHLGAGGAPIEIDMPLLVANGVTGMREMWADCHTVSPLDCLGQRRSWQKQIEAGDLVGPRLLALASWPVNGPRGLPNGVPAFFGAANAEQGRLLARYFAERKVDFIKIYPNIPREGFLALAAEARRLGLSVAGHEPLALSAIEASEAGLQSFEHARVFLLNCFRGAAELRRLDASATASTKWRRSMVDEFDLKACQPVFSAFVKNRTRYVPTHLTRRMEAFADDPAFRQDPRSKYIPKAQWTAWNRDADGVVARDSSPQGRKVMMDFYTKGLEITGAAHRAGVQVMLGTDSGDSYVFAGFAVHEELEELVKAGLTPAEALRTATWNGAEFLGRTSDSGSLEQGKRADLILLDANPLSDIRNTRKIAAVVLNGRYLDRSALDLLLSVAEAAARR
jgi:hypothetical protein